MASMSQSNLAFFTTAGEMFLSNLKAKFFVKYSLMCFGPLHTYSWVLLILVNSQTAERAMLKEQIVPNE